MYNTMYNVYSMMYIYIYMYNNYYDVLFFHTLYSALCRYMFTVMLEAKHEAS